MIEDELGLNIPLQQSNKAIVVPIRFEITTLALKYLKKILIEFIESSNNAKGVVFDLKGVLVIDGEDFNELLSIFRICEMMGLKTYVCGLEPGLVAAIVFIDLDTSMVNAVFNLSDALMQINKL